jgi:hypothetical protein
MRTITLKQLMQDYWSHTIMRTITLKQLSTIVLPGVLVCVSMFASNAQAASPTVTLIAQAPPAAAPQAQPTPQQRAAMLKQWLQASQAQLRAYEWVETTVVSKDGEEKSRKQMRCFYGADGKVQKIDLQPSAEEKSGLPGILPLGRLAKKAAEHEKEAMTEYMHKAVELVHSYIPPDPANIQSAINNGKLSMQVLDPGRRVQLNFADYLKAGDTLGVQIETLTNRLLGVSVNSYLDTAEDAIALNVTMSVLPDGTIYTARSLLDARAKGISVTVENGGYRRMQ